VYVQLRVQQHATFHLEVLTTKDLSVRLTVSTLYAEDKARFLGTSLRYCTYCSVLQCIVLYCVVLCCVVLCCVVV
jgi:hypothetical protein